MDGLTDCADPDCKHYWFCTETVCNDWSDDDNDGLTDCQDPDCAAWDGGTWRFRRPGRLRRPGLF